MEEEIEEVGRQLAIIVNDEMTKASPTSVPDSQRADTQDSWTKCGGGGRICI